MGGQAEGCRQTRRVADPLGAETQRRWVATHRTRLLRRWCPTLRFVSSSNGSARARFGAAARRTGLRVGAPGCADGGSKPTRLCVKKGSPDVNLSRALADKPPVAPRRRWWVKHAHAFGVAAKRTGLRVGAPGCADGGSSTRTPSALPRNEPDYGSTDGRRTR